MTTARSTNVLAPVALAILLTMLAVIFAIVAWGAADRYLAQLNITDPEIAKHEPMLGYAPTRTSRRVVLVIIDGLRLPDSFGRHTWDRLRRAGVDAVATSHYPTISRPNHITIVTGVPPLVSGVRNNTYRSAVHVDSIMDRVRASGLQVSFVSDVSSSLAYLFADDFDSVHYGRWPGGFVKSATLVMRQNTSSLVVLLPGAVDEAGHSFGGDSDEYRSAVDFVAKQLDEVFARVDLERDTIVITSDHGHTDSGGHGGEERIVTEVPLIFAGAGINPSALLGRAELIDVAPTVAALLGVPAPGHALGRTLTEVLRVDEQETAALRDSDQKRIHRSASLYLDSLDAASVELIRQQRHRMLLLAGSFVLVVILTWFARRSGALLIDWRVLVIAVPAYPLCYFGLLDVLGQSLSFSTIQDRGSEMSSLSRFGLIATGVQLVAGWIALRGRVVLRDRLAAANALIFCGLLVAWIPAASLWVYHGPAPHLDIPGSTVALLIPATYIAVATYAIGAALLLTVEIIVFFARAIDPRVRLRRLERAAARQRRRIESGG